MSPKKKKHIELYDHRVFLSTDITCLLLRISGFVWVIVTNPAGELIVVRSTGIYWGRKRLDRE